MPRGIPAPDVLAARRAAMGQLKATLRREGRSQAWLVRELGRRGFATSPQSMSNYVNGYSRIAAATLDAACILAGGGMTTGDLLRADILAAVGDVSLLLQDAASQGKRKAAS